ncbi:hypothetical protein ACFW1P_09865 [Paenibacillus sp. NPDC058910]|uniref:hypothetical protein n=1 Tax=unclassified Paenibacillus TaxID=185978 RepID=UPI00367BF87B
MENDIPSLKEQQEMIDILIGMNLQNHDWRGLARNINQNPEDVFPDGSTNPDKADAIVSTAVRYGKSADLFSAMSRLRSDTQDVKQVGISKLDNQIAIQLAGLYSELLRQLDTINDIDEADLDQLSGNVEDFTEFHEKLREKAKFSPSVQILAVDSKNDNSVLKRKAKKLGTDANFKLLNRKIQVFYSKRILVKFPPNEYSADFRFNELVEQLFSILPEEFQQRDDITDQIFGVIFDATFQCLIFNE